MNINIAIVGEGPIGLITLAKLLTTHYKNTSKNIPTLNITLYKKYNDFKRRHVLFLSNGIVKKIEEDILECDNCIRKDISGDLQISTRLLENILFDNIKTKKNYCKYNNTNKCSINIINKEFTENDYTLYDHVFIASGFQSKLRFKLFTEGMNYEPLKVLSKESILVLYTNIAPVTSTNYLDDVNSRFEFIEEETLESFGLNTLELTVFINIIYSFNKYLNLFNEKNKSIDLWVLGFTNYNNFESVFSKTIKDIQEYLKYNSVQDIINILLKNNVTIKDLDITLLNSIKNNTDYYIDLWYKYKQFVRTLLLDKKSIDKLFMLHAVLPATKMLGCYLDENKLQFCIKKNNTNIWLLGDGAVAYPPTYSLELNLTFVNYIIPKFYKYYIKGILNNFTPNYAINILSNIKLDEYTSNIKLIGGFPDNDRQNNNDLKTLPYLISLIASNLHKNVKDINSFMLYYNITLFVYYIKNVSKIMSKKLPIFKFRKQYNQLNIIKYANTSSKSKSTVKNSSSMSLYNSKQVSKS